MSDELSDDRKIGLKMALAAGAAKTAETIKDPSSSFENIFSVAEKEIGKERFLEQLLQGPPSWSHIAVSYMELDGPAREQLAARAATAKNTAPQAGSVLVDSASEMRAVNWGGPLSKMSLNNAMAATVQWTVQWQDDSKEQPKTAYPDWTKWHWSGDLTAGCSSTMSLATIAQAVPNAPLNKGDTVWIYVWVAAGADMNSKGGLYQFTYDPGSTLQAYWSASGTTHVNNNLSLLDYKAS